MSDKKRIANNSPKVLLIYPRLEKGDNPFFKYPWAPISYLYLASFLLDAGIDVEIFDQRLGAEEEARAKERWKTSKDGYLFAVLITTTGEQVGFALDIAKWLRSNIPSMPLVWGGSRLMLSNREKVSIPSVFPEVVARNPLVDLVVREGGELIIPAIAKFMINGNKFPAVDLPENGINVANMSGKLVLNAVFPYEPDRMSRLPLHLIKMDDYLNPRTGYWPVHVSAGCPNRCTFCIVNTRYIRPENDCFLKIIDSYSNVDGIKNLKFFDPNFLANKKRSLELFTELKKRGNKLGIICSADLTILKLFTPEEWGVMYDGGLRRIGFGSESGSPRMLQLIKKRYRHEDMFIFLERIKNVPINLFTSFMVMLPTETVEDVAMTRDYIFKIAGLNPRLVIGVNIFYPTPASEIAGFCRQFGYREPDTLEGWRDSKMYYEFQECRTAINDLPWVSNDLAAEYEKTLNQIYEFIRGRYVY